MHMSSPSPVVHLELHTGDQARASAFYAKLLCWRPQPIGAGSGSYLAVELGAGFGGGIVECGTARPLWLPYVEVDQIHESTERACQLGASVLLAPREGPADGAVSFRPRSAASSLSGRQNDDGRA